MAEKSGIAIFIIIIFTLIIVAFLLYLAYMGRKQCPDGDFTVTGQTGCFINQPVYICTTAGGSENYVVGTYNFNYGCLAQQGSSNCVTYSNNSDCNNALNDTDPTKYPNISTTPNTTNFIACTSDNYAQSGNICNYLLTRFKAS